VGDGQVFRRTGLTVDALAREIKVPAYRLSRHFSQSMHTTFPAWLNALRIRWVCDILLREPDRTVLEIAMDAGYSSKAVFHTQFVRAQGRSPGDFRRLHAGKPTRKS